VKGQPLATLFFVPAIVQLIVAIRKAKEGISELGSRAGLRNA
jgi:hypothetical protein